MAKTDNCGAMILDKKETHRDVHIFGIVFTLEGLASSKEGSERQGKTARERRISEDRWTKTGAEELLMRHVWNPEQN